jgi:hypothetical protein
MKRHIQTTGAALFLAIAITAIPGCDDEGGDSTVIGAGGGAERDSGTLGGGGSGPTPLPTGGNDGAGGDDGAGGQGAGADDGGSGGDGAGGQATGGEDGSGGATGECVAGERRCVEEGQPFYQACLQGGEWAVQPCDADTVCFDGRCVPDPTACEAGDRICTDTDQPAECVPGDGWVDVETCAEGEICVDGGCSSRACAEVASSLSYLGCEFYATALPNSAGDGMPVGIVVTNPDLADPVRVWLADAAGMPARLVPSANLMTPPDAVAQGAPLLQQSTGSTVQDPDGRLIEEDLGQAWDLEIPPGGIATLLLNRAADVERRTLMRRDAYNLRTTRPVAAYQFSPYCCNFAFSNDASLLFPVSALGTEYRFLGVPTMFVDNIVPTPPQQQARAQIAVVGVQEQTSVEIQLPAGATIEPPAAGGVVQQGQRVTATLNPADVLLVQSGAAVSGGFGPPTLPDLSGALITASNPVAVFSSHHCSFYPRSSPACDHLEEQLFPTGTWGNEFTLVPPVARRDPPRPTELIYWKIIARDPATTITLSAPFDSLSPAQPGFEGVPYCGDALQGADTIVLNAGSFCEFGTQRPVRMTATGALQVMGIVSGQNAAVGQLAGLGNGAGDPAIFLVPPDRQFRSDYAFLAPATYASDFLTVITPPGARLVLDDSPVDLGDAVAVPGADVVFKHIPIVDGPHRVQSDRPFGILVFAYDDFVSYAFTGGLNLRKR